MIKVTKNTSELDNLKEDWDLLYNNDKESTPYQSFVFNKLHWGYWARPNDQLYIITIYRQSDNVPLLLLPSYLDNKGNLRFITELFGDFCSPLYNYRIEEEYNVFEELSDYICNTKKISGFTFSNVKPGNPLCSYLNQRINKSVCLSQNGYSYFDVNPVSKTESDAIITLSNAKDRNRVKKIVNKMGQVSYHIYPETTQMEFPRMVVEDLMKEMINKGLRTANYFSTSFKLFVEDLYKERLICIITTEEENVVRSASISFVSPKCNEYIQWLALYTEKQYNIWNILNLVNSLRHSEGGRVNFARGIYEYKNRNFRPRINNLMVIKYKKSNIKNKLSLFKFALTH